MIMDILKVTNKIVLGYLDEYFKPFVKVWFGKKQVIEEKSNNSNWDGVTFHDYDEYNRVRQVKNEKVENNRDPLSTRSQQNEEEKIEKLKVENIHWPYSETP